MADLTVYLVDDNDAFRQSTAWLLAGEGLHVTEFSSGLALLDVLDSSASMPEHCCILTDLRMPEMSGFELMEALRKRKIKLPVIVITGHGDVSLAVDTMQRGAASFVEKPFDEKVLIETIRTTLSDPGALLRNPKGAEEKLARLSPRERQVLDHVCAGKLNKTIADILGISIKTVELHRSNMVTKLNVRNVQDLVRLTLGYE